MKTTLGATVHGDNVSTGGAAPTHLADRVRARRIDARRALAAAPHGRSRTPPRRGPSKGARVMEPVLEAGATGLGAVLVFTGGLGALLVVGGAQREPWATTTPFVLAVLSLGKVGQGLGQRQVRADLDGVPDLADKVAVVNMGTGEAAANLVLSGGRRWRSSPWRRRWRSPIATPDRRRCPPTDGDGALTRRRHRPRCSGVRPCG